MPRPLNILLVAIGSHGDVHPFVGIGVALRSRGHRVRVIVNDYFAPLVRQAGLESISVGSADEYRELATHPDLWHRSKGTRFVFQAMGRLIRPVYDTIVAHNLPGETVVAHSSLGLGARIAQDKLNIPTASIHLQPSVLRSAIEPAILPGLPMGRWTPISMRRLIYAAADLLIIDRLIGPPVNAVRAELGLPPVRRLLDGWWNSPQRVIGLFPPWFAPPQPDWPPQTRLTGFPLFDESGLTALPPELEAFLAQGKAPIAFTPGSAMWSGQDFFSESAQACVILGCRGVLLSRHRDHIPRELPPGVIHLEYAPFSQLLPRCAAIVHHGGIGTSAQALAAGVPQLIMPRAHDQPDNAARLKRLNVARSISPRRYKAGHVATMLNKLLVAPRIAACRAVRSRFAGIDPVGQTCDLIEALSTTG